VKELGGLLLAVAGWSFTFGFSWGNFWIKIGIAVFCVTAYSLIWQRPVLRLSWKSLGLGLLSAALLYGVFFIGNALAPYVVSGAHGQVAGIYGLGERSSRVWIFLLLLLVTGPGEEIFWRGFLQDRLMKRWGPLWGFVAATTAYSSVHLFSLNPMLILAALVAGLFWGAQYLWKRDLTALIVSHSLWSAVIFAVLPIR
jgi:uncharacterized protein